VIFGGVVSTMKLYFSDELLPWELFATIFQYHLPSDKAFPLGVVLLVVDESKVKFIHSSPSERSVSLSTRRVWLSAFSPVVHWNVGVISFVHVLFPGDVSVG